jgi:hypothetical protein
VSDGLGALAKAGCSTAPRHQQQVEFLRGCSRKAAGAWVKEARWVEDGRVFTSSGVTAGIDMALAIIAHFDGPAGRREDRGRHRNEWHRDPSWTIRKLAGLV